MKTQETTGKPKRVSIKFQPDTEAEVELIHKYCAQTGVSIGPLTRILWLEVIGKAVREGRVVL